MYKLQRIANNPFLLPNKDHAWEAVAAFNPCLAQDGGTYHLLYRAQSFPQSQYGNVMSMSSIGYATSTDGVHFEDRRQLIKPDHRWEQFGCEDPRITKLGDKYYIFYTALSTYPFGANGIRVGLAMTRDFKEIEKHAVTPFNSKAMALFPEKINGQFVAILTVNTDKPPAKIAIAFFESEEQMWSGCYWEDWYAFSDRHVIPLLRGPSDHLEVGAPPIKTKAGWLLVYSYIQNYFSDRNRVFGIEAVLLDLKNPQKVIGRTSGPLLIPEKDYELKGDVENVIFPSGVLIDGEEVVVYYGAADTTCCAAVGKLDELLAKMMPDDTVQFVSSTCIEQGFQRYANNPVITPRPEFSWESKATFNPAAIYEDGVVHIVYRAMSHDNTSVFGYASSRDGVHIDERLPIPIYEPREFFEQKLRPGNSGCEDPRITRLDDRIYLFYTAFDGYTPRVAFTSITVDNFVNRRWHWDRSMVITPPNIPDKDACLLPKKINGKFVIFHRAGDCIRINLFDDLVFGEGKWLDHKSALIKPRKEYWDNYKFGIASPPIETAHGWLLLFHRVTKPNSVYKIEALLLDLDNPVSVIAETGATLLEPEMQYEKVGQVPNVVFPCGAVVIDDDLLIYYGGADTIVAVAKIKLATIFKRLGI